MAWRDSRSLAKDASRIGIGMGVWEPARLNVGVYSDRSKSFKLLPGSQLLLVHLTAPPSHRSLIMVSVCDVSLAVLNCEVQRLMTTS